MEQIKSYFTREGWERGWELTKSHVQAFGRLLGLNISPDLDNVVDNIVGVLDVSVGACQEGGPRDIYYEVKILSPQPVEEIVEDFQRFLKSRGEKFSFEEPVKINDGSGTVFYRGALYFIEGRRANLASVVRNQEMYNRLSDRLPDGDQMISAVKIGTQPIYGKCSTLDEYAQRLSRNNIQEDKVAPKEEKKE